MFKQSLIYLSFFLLVMGCDQSNTSSTGASTSSEGSTLSSIDTALASISTTAGISSLESGSGDIGAFGGVASTYCNANGGPTNGSSTNLTSTDNEYASYTGFCQLTHNAQSPDNPRGAMYISSGIACEVGRLGGFNNLTTDVASTVTGTATISTSCWGTQAQVDAMVDDMGSSTLSLSVAVTKLATGSAYDYKLVFNVGGEITVHLKNSATVKAAHVVDSGGSWAVKMDTSTPSATTIHYEGINTTDSRRMRIHVTGALNTSTNTFTSIATAKGFWLQGSGGSYSNFITFTGNLSDGFIGNNYPSSGSNLTDKCHFPGATPSCTGLTAIASSSANAVSLHSALSSANTSLSAYTSAVIDTSTIDPTDTDITD